MLDSPDLRAANIREGDSGRRQPAVVLLDNKQWSYVQNRYNLTPRERQIAELICQGLRNGSIAKILRIKPGTVKTHTRNIYRKVHVKSKIAMLLRFVTEARDLFNPYEGTRSAPVAD
jgi:DNA-binding CsgD family transcriptional regulator